MVDLSIGTPVDGTPAVLTRALAAGADSPGYPTALGTAAVRAAAADWLARLDGPADPAADLRIGVVHSPEPRVLDRFAADGYDLLLCGHTHGGQLRVPGFGALVTNCGIDRDRVRWLHRWAPPSAANPNGTWLHISAGLGTSPYAPVRFACPPEATLLTLTARPA